jgi:purine nucleoside permease
MAGAAGMACGLGSVPVTAYFISASVICEVCARLLPAAFSK